MTKVVTIQGRDAYRRTMSALAKAFPNAVAKAVSQHEQAAGCNINKEKPNMTHEEMINELASQLDGLAADIGEITKVSPRRTDVVEDDWSSAGADGFDEDPDGDQDDDNGDEDDNDDDSLYEKAAPPPLAHHKFQTVVNRIAAERGVSKVEAAQAARRENPTLFESYQASGLVGNAADQALVTYDKALRREIAKGVSENCARQRLATQGIAPRADDGGIVTFMHKVQLEQQRSGCGRVEAMQKVRVARPDLFKKYQEV